MIAQNIFNRKRGSNQWDVRLQAWHSSGYNCSAYFQLLANAELLVGVSSRLPSARHVAWWGHSVASGTLGHFPSEEQQCFDLWESSLSAARVRSWFPDLAHVLLFSVLPGALDQQRSAVMRISRDRKECILCHTANNGGQHVTDSEQAARLHACDV